MYTRSPAQPARSSRYAPTVSASGSDGASGPQPARTSPPYAAIDPVAVGGAVSARGASPTHTTTSSARSSSLRTAPSQAARNASSSASGPGAHAGTSSGGCGHRLAATNTRPATLGDAAVLEDILDLLEAGQ